MKILVACEFSGRVREAFKKQGHEAWSCDLQATEIPGNHIQGDVLQILDQGWDMMIAHPPCTRLTNSGVVWLHKRNLWEEMRTAAEFFKMFLDAPIPKICVENPIPHKYALEIIGRKYDQTIQPYQFGHLETKRTCFWLKNLPPLIATSDLKKETYDLPSNQRQRLHYLPPTEDRANIRSKTYPGIAQAMALQWGTSNIGLHTDPCYSFPLNRRTG
jgi:hypothetical protein